MKALRQIEQRVLHLRSPKRSHTVYGLLLLILVCALLLWWKHSTLLAAPNNYMLGANGDGFKNYMTSTWHVRYDSSYVHYSGMNYPFGEHVLFTDNQPVFSACLQWWSRHIHDVSSQTVGIMNVFLLLSMLLACSILFLLLRKLHFPLWYAGLAALTITFLSPQYNRLDGHFGLSHMFVFPLLLYLLCIYEERFSRRYQSLMIGALVWFSAQLHFYFFGLSALFLTLYTGFQIVRDFSKITLIRRLSHWVVMVLIPFALLNGWIHWADFASDRPANPFGFTVYIGYWEGVFLPYKSFPLYQWIETHLIKIREINPEAIAYAGMLALLFTLWLLFSGFRMFDKSWNEAAYHRVHKHFLRGIFFASFLLLLFSFGFPFAIKGMEWMVDYMGPLRQFRGLGRFTWAFYYVINILAFYTLWNWSVRFKGIRGKAIWLKWVIVLAPLVLTGYEAILFQKTRKIELAPNLARRSIAAPTPEHWLNKVDFNRFQALLPLPYYHMGSENIWLEFDFGHFKKVQTTAYHTGVPDMGVNLSRTSARQTTESVQFIKELCEMPAMLNELADSRPIALLVEPQAWDRVREEYPQFIRKAQMVYDHPELRILSIRPDSIRAYVRDHNAEVERDFAKQAQFAFGPWISTRNAKDFYYTSYDSLPTTPLVFQGKGAYEGNMKDTTWIWNKPMPRGFYYISCWIYVSQDMAMTQEMKIIENRRSDGQEVHFQHEGMRFYLKTIVNGWGLFDIPFEVRDPDSNMRIFLQKPNVDQRFFLDEVLIKPADISLYRREPGWLVRNNFWFRE